ncbi:MAG TPA: dTDP-4-dehydrorhamnose reductase [Pseudonocardiaceae bacterium]|nr:dTDP-4-dehydrorhamnose reductase [Pseudonocardiaceae bacterium]
MSIAVSCDNAATGPAPLALLIPGGHGQLGSDLAALGARYGEVSAPGSTQLDVTDVAAVRAAVGELAETARAAGRFPVVCNAAAYTAVDRAESDVDGATAVNSFAPGLLAQACARHGVPLLHVSTDYVFAGDAGTPYEPADPTGPRSVYGRTKLAGEEAVSASGADAWIVRTAWVYGATGKNFVKTMVRLAGERDTLSVVDDQQGSPTWSAHLAAGLLELAARLARGRGPAQRVLHCTGGGRTTWFGLARAIFAEIGADPERVRPCTTEQYPLPAPRPAYSVLADTSWRAAGLTALPDWRAALGTFFAEHKETLLS